MGNFVHIFRFFLIFSVPLFALDKEIKVSTLDSAYIRLFLDSLLENQSSYSIEYHLLSFNGMYKTEAPYVKNNG